MVASRLLRGPTVSARRSMQRVRNLQEGELQEVRISGYDLRNAVLAHQDCGMDVVEKISGRVAEFIHNGFQRLEVAAGRSQKGDFLPRGQGSGKLQRLGSCQRFGNTRL